MSCGIIEFPRDHQLLATAKGQELEVPAVRAVFPAGKAAGYQEPGLAALALDNSHFGGGLGCVVYRLEHWGFLLRAIMPLRGLQGDKQTPRGGYLKDE
jgi:hypothetical protein